MLGGNLCGAYACFTAHPFPYTTFTKKKVTIFQVSYLREIVFAEPYILKLQE